MSPEMHSLEEPKSLKERLGQLVMVRIGSNLPPIVRAHEDEERVERLLERCPLGGLLLFNGTWPATRDAFERLQERSRVPLLIASDIERGAGQQMEGLTLFPHQRAFLDLPDAEAWIARFCEVTAREARASGIHVTFGPVADVNSDPRNPIIATRAYGDDPERAGVLVEAYVRAAEKAHLLTTAKHFPGHGDTHQDSHDAMPRVTADRATLEQRELSPFRAAIRAGTSLIMTAHVEYPALDPTGTPATLSRPILTDLLRGEMGFEGVVCSDSLLMAGVRERFDSEGEMAIAALNAGVDLLLDVADPIAVLEALEAGVSRGRIDEARVEEAFRRVWSVKQRAFAEVAERSLEEEWRVAANEKAIETAVRATWIDRSSGKAPFELDPRTPLTALLLKPHHRPTDPAEQPLAQALRERFARVDYVERGPEIEPALVEELLRRTTPETPFLIAMIVKPAAWHAFGLSASQRELVTRLLEARPCHLACLGVANALDEFPKARVRCCTHSDVPASQLALARLLAGSRS